MRVSYTHAHIRSQCLNNAFDIFIMHVADMFYLLRLHTGDVQIWDVVRCVIVRTYRAGVYAPNTPPTPGHRSRVGVIAWNGHQDQLTSGSRDHAVLHHDLRDTADIVARFGAHSQEVCGLRWSPDGTKLASGGNDNRLLVCVAQHEHTHATNTHTHARTSTHTHVHMHIQCTSMTKGAPSQTYNTAVYLFVLKKPVYCRYGTSRSIACPSTGWRSTRLRWRP